MHSSVQVLKCVSGAAQHRLRDIKDAASSFKRGHMDSGVQVLKPAGRGVTVDEDREKVRSLGGRCALSVDVGAGLVGQGAKCEVFEVLENLI